MYKKKILEEFTKPQHVTTSGAVCNLNLYIIQLSMKHICID